MSPDTIERTVGSPNLRLGTIQKRPANHEANGSFRGGEIDQMGMQVFRNEFAYAAEATETAAKISTSPLSVLASAARQPETDRIMEALLRECLRARSLEDLSDRS